MTHTQDLCTAKDGRIICGKTAPHPGERHTSHFGAGTYTWGYEPTSEEVAHQRYEEGLAAGLSDHEAREDGWPTI